MNDAKALCLPLQPLVKLCQKYCPKDDAAVKSMKDVPYVSGYSSSVDAMVATRSDIAHAVGVLSKFVATSGKAHWEAIKLIMKYLKHT